MAVVTLWRNTRLLGSVGRRREHASTSSGASFYFRPIFFLHGPTQLLPDSSSSSRTAGTRQPLWEANMDRRDSFLIFFPPRWDWKTSPTEGWAGLPKRPLTVRLGQSDLTAGGDWSTASLPLDVPRSLMDTLMSPVKYSQVPLPGTPVSDGGLSPGGEV